MRVILLYRKFGRTMSKLLFMLLLCLSTLVSQAQTYYVDPVTSLRYELHSTQEGYVGNWAEVIAPERGSLEEERYNELTEVEIPREIRVDGESYKILGIGHFCFSYSQKLKKVKLPDTIEEISRGAFHECTALDSIVLPNSLISLEDFAFQGCSSLDSISIPEGVEYIGNECFLKCSNLKKVTWPASATEIPSGCFSGCTALTQFKIPEGVTYVGEGILGNTQVNTLILPKSLLRADGYFGSCKIIISANPIPPVLDTKLSRTYVQNVFVPEGSVEAYQKAFGWKNVADSIEAVQMQVESGGLLYDLDLFSNHAILKACADKQLRDKSYLSLKSVVFANEQNYRVTEIADGCFENFVNLRHIDLPSLLLGMEANAFKGCSNLKTIFVAEDPAHFCEDTFDKAVYENCQVYTLSDSVSYYQRSDEWRRFSHPVLAVKKKIELENGLFFSIADTHLEKGQLQASLLRFAGKGIKELQIPESITLNSRDYAVVYVPDSTFAKNNDLVKIVLPNSITKMGYYVFSDCPNLETVVMPAGLESISWNTFADCIRLKNVVLPKNLKRLSGFQGCIALENVQIPEGVDTIDYAFENCTSLKSVELPKSLKCIGTNAFKDCTALKSIEMPENVEEIGPSGFEGCTALESVKLNEGVKTLGKSLFENCTSLKKLVIPQTVVSLGKECLAGCSSLESIYNYSSEPQEVSDVTYFSKYWLGDQALYETCVLYVLSDYLVRYSKDQVWGYFNRIQGIEPTGITGVHKNSTDLKTVVYTLNGACVSKDGNINSLPKGIYVVNGKKIVK